MNILLHMVHVPTQENPADAPSCRPSPLDCKLPPEGWDKVQQEFSSAEGHSRDLMALDSNTMTDKLWYPLPHFTQYPLPDSMGVTMFSQDLTKFPTIMQRPYIFLPNVFVGPLLPFILEVIGGPCYKTTPGKHERSLGQVTDVLLLPSREGWSCDSGIPGDLWAILVTFLYKL